MHKTQRMQDAGIDNVFFWINPVEIYTIFSAVLHEQSKSDIMMSFGHPARSAVCYKAGFPFNWRG
jgi:hypothetical protein